MEESRLWPVAVSPAGLCCPQSLGSGCTITERADLLEVCPGCSRRQSVCPAPGQPREPWLKINVSQSVEGTLFPPPEVLVLHCSLPSQARGHQASPGEVWDGSLRLLGANSLRWSTPALGQQPMVPIQEHAPEPCWGGTPQAGWPCPVPARAGSWLCTQGLRDGAVCEITHSPWLLQSLAPPCTVRKWILGCLGAVFWRGNIDSFALLIK